MNNLPIIIASKLVENADGSASVSFDYDENFLKFVGEELKCEDPTQDQINDFMLRHVNRVGARIQRVFYCTHRSDAGCDCRNGLELLR